METRIFEGEGMHIPFTFKISAHFSSKTEEPVCSGTVA